MPMSDRRRYPLKKFFCKIRRSPYGSSILLLACILAGSCFVNAGDAEPYKIDYSQYLLAEAPANIEDDSFCAPYLKFMREVFEVMDREYYLSASKDIFESFADKFKKSVLYRLSDKSKVIEDIKFLGAGLLVNKLKAEDDEFTNFIPPAKVEEFKNDILGYDLGVGITGELLKNAYLIRHVELRSGAFRMDIVPGDLILSINDRPVAGLTIEEVQALLFPPLGTKTRLEIFSRKEGAAKVVDLTAEKFFRETLSSRDTGIRGLRYIKIDQFNKETGPDFKKLLAHFMRDNLNYLIMDLRGNAGGPPLAARELAGLFLPPETTLFFFQRKGRPRIMLSAPASEVVFTGNLAILIDKGSGSASELFSGTLRSYGRALLIGEPSAGKTFLKSLYEFGDGSMLILVTSPAYLYTGERYDPLGLKPDFTLKEDDDLFSHVLRCLKESFEK